MDRTEELLEAILAELRKLNGRDARIAQRVRDKVIQKDELERAQREMQAKGRG